MTRLISIDNRPERARRISAVSLGLAILALSLMIGEWVINPTSDAVALAFVQVVVAVVCLAVGAVYLFSEHRDADGDVIDLREDGATTEAPSAPRQVPDARGTGIFAT